MAGAQTPQAGTSAAVRGDVERLAQQAAAARKVASGDAIFMQDRIDSGIRSGMQLMLLDETVFTIGADSSVLIDEFVYDPDAGAGKLTADVSKGVFRFVTGKVAQNRPSDMQVRMPVATIGIRGTMVIGRYDGRRGFVGLVGPGLDRNSRDRRGEVEVSNAGGSVRLSRPGWGVYIDGPNVPPSQPFPIPTALYGELLQSLNAGAVAPTDIARPPSEEAIIHSRQPTYSNLATLEAVNRTEETVSEDDGEVIEVVQQTGSFADGQSTYEDLRSIPSGQFHYFQGSVPITGGGSYDIAMDIDFAARTVGGGSSGVTFFSNSLLSSGSIPLNPQSFASGSGPAQFTFNDVAFGSGCMTTCSVIVTATPLNSSGVVAGALSHLFAIIGNTTETGSGIASRNSGLSF